MTGTSQTLRELGIVGALADERHVQAADFSSAAEVAASVAAHYAVVVDRDARFPREAMAALRRYRMLSAMIPTRLGGDGVSLQAVAAACQTLGEACSSSAMIFAMHQMQIACLLEYGAGESWCSRLLERIAVEQLLLTSAVIESDGRHASGTGELNAHGKRFDLECDPVRIPYGAYADILLVSMARPSGGDARDRATVVLPSRGFTLERHGDWDAMGMRGICLEEFKLCAAGRIEQVLATDLGDGVDTTVRPIEHILCSAVWTGIAMDGLKRARRYFVKHVGAAQTMGASGVVRLSEAEGMVQMMRARVDMALTQQAKDGHPDTTSDALAYACDMNALKISVSTTALQAVNHAMLICGMDGYRNGTSFSLGRHLRDLYAAPLAIPNDRIAANSASMILALRR